MYTKTHCRDTLKSLRAPKAAVFGLGGDVLRKIAAAQKKSKRHQSKRRARAAE